MRDCQPSPVDLKYSKTSAFDFIGTQLAECDTHIEQQLQALQVHDGEPAKGKKRGRARNAPKFDLRTQLFKMCGVDLTRIDGIDVTTALAVISETGADMTRFARSAEKPVIYQPLEGCFLRETSLAARQPVARLSCLRGDRVDLRSSRRVFFVEHRVVKPIKVVEPHAKVTVRPSLLVLDQQAYYALVLKEEGLCQRWAGVLHEIQRGLFELRLGFWMKPVVHAIFARILASASSPGTMLTFPERTSSRRLLASCAQAR